MKSGRIVGSGHFFAHAACLIGGKRASVNEPQHLFRWGHSWYGRQCMAQVSSGRRLLPSTCGLRLVARCHRCRNRVASTIPSPLTGMPMNSADGQDCFRVYNRTVHRFL